MGKYKNKIIAGLVIIIILAAAFFWGGNAPGLKSTPTDDVIETQATKEPQNTPIVSPTPATEEVQVQTPVPEVQRTTPTPAPKTQEVVKTLKPTVAPIPTQEITDQNNTQIGLISDTKSELVCTISIKCDTILANLDWLDEAKKDIIPTDGIILKEIDASFDEGENVFDVLERVTKENKIHLEFVHAPIYNSAYIEGIANIYEFDCGELSGWVYKVNGTPPKYGCSKHLLKSGDRIEWVYTCNLGKDVGGHNFF